MAEQIELVLFDVSPALMGKRAHTVLIPDEVIGQEAASMAMRLIQEPDKRQKSVAVPMPITHSKVYRPN